MKRLITILSLLAVLLTGCYREPYADFTMSPTQPVAGQDISFTNISMDAESFEWDFGDGYSSIITNPIHAYEAGGVYTVTLKAFGRKGDMSVATATVNVIAIDPFADFDVTTNLPGQGDVVTDVVYVGEEVILKNYSTDADAYLWEFGDGTTANVVAPVMSYDEPGTYNIKLHAYGSGNTENILTKTIEVYEGIDATVRITVLEYYDLYPVEGASVLLYGSLYNWDNEIDPSYEVFTSPLGKAVFEGMNNQVYYVDVLEDHHDNYLLRDEDVGFIETQFLEAGYIHDFIAYVDYYPDGKKMVLTRISKKALAKEEVAKKAPSEYRKMKENKFSKER